MSSDATSRAVIRAHQVSKSFAHRSGHQVPVLRGLDFELAPGRVTALVGRSGSGKTTLLQALGLLSRPDAGTVTVNGTDTATLGGRALADLRRAEIGFVFQAANLLPQHCALTNVVLPWHGPTAAGRSRASDLLAGLGLADRAEHRPDQLSGGEQQRVAIARALINDPGALLADEPTGNLDTATEALLLDVFADLAAQGKAVLLVTHSLEVAARADIVYAMGEGTVSLERARTATA